MRRWQSAGQRDLRTVLFTDIVGSTEEAARIGDRAWANLLARHHSAVRAALRRSDGHEEDTAGDGFFATFARPTDALAAAAEIVREVATLGLSVRVGLHAGEVEHQDGKATGITVHVAARLMAAAGSGEVLASATVRDLAAGAGWSFVDRGSLELKGLAEPVHAYALDLARAPAIAGSARIHGVSAGPLPAFMAAALVLVVVAVLGLRLTGGSAGPGASPSSVALGSTQPAGVASSPGEGPGASPAVDAVPIPLPGVDLTPGLYSASGFPGEPTFTIAFTIADPGWRVANSSLVLVGQTSPEDELRFGFTRSLASDPCGYKPGVPLGGNPEPEFLAWARSNPALQLSPNEGLLREFGDLTTTQFNVSIVARYACVVMNPVSLAITPRNGAATDESQAGLFSMGTRLRLEVSSHDGQLLLITISTPTGADFDTFDAMAEKLLNTIHFPP